MLKLFKIIKNYYIISQCVFLSNTSLKMAEIRSKQEDYYIILYFCT